jgi:phage-related protein (TIGR01555 family)
VGNVVSFLRDGLTSLVSGLGTDRDKAATAFYLPNTVTDQEAFAMYEGSALARNIVDFPAIDSCREWRDWQADKDQIELLEAEEDRLDVQFKVLQARKWARLFGGCAIYIGVEDSDLTQPLQPERIGKQGLKYLTVLDRNLLTAGQLDADPASEWYGKPITYSLTTQESQVLDLHPSRLVIFTGNERPNIMNANVTVQGWGSSVLGACKDDIVHSDSTAANIASLVYEAKVDVIAIEGLMDQLQGAGGKKYQESLLARFTLAMQVKGNNGALILDAKEEYSQKTIAMSGLPDVLASFLQRAAGASRIPATRLLGQAPQGMNATGEGDYKNYLDLIGAEQELQMTPAMRRLDECLIRSALGSRPDSIYYMWAPIWRQSEKEKADIFKIKADAARVLVGTSPGTEIIPPEAVSEALINTLVEDGSLPGLDTAIDKYGTLEENKPTPEEIAAANNLAAANQNRRQQQKQQQPKKTAANDVSPRSLYVYRQVMNAKDIIAWAKSQGFSSTLPADELHVTIVYSTEPVDWLAVGDSWDDELLISRGGARIVEKLGNATVLIFNNRSLQWRNQEIRDNGASWDFAEYTPHISITYEGAPKDLSTVTPYQGPIHLGPEIFEEVDESHQTGAET